MRHVSPSATHPLARRTQWRTRVGAFVLLMGMLMQSMLTLACGLDDIGGGATAAADVQFVALELAAELESQGECSGCGGPKTATGCCFHAVPVTRAMVVFTPSAPPDLAPTFLLSRTPHNTPSDLFRPPQLS